MGTKIAYGTGLVFLVFATLTAPELAPLSVSALVGSLLFSLRLGANNFKSRLIYFAHLAIVIFVGAGLAHIRNLPETRELVASTSVYLALLFISALSSLTPLILITAAEFGVKKHTPGHAWRAIMFPAVAFSCAGLVQSLFGVGNSLSWTRRTGPAGWWASIGGQPLIDFLIAGFASSLVWCLSEMPPTTPYRDNIEEEEVEDRERILFSTENDSDLAVQKHFKKGGIIAMVFLAAILAPTLFHNTSYAPSHPSHMDPDFFYPPVRVGCVSPVGTKKGSDRIDSWLHETTVLAGRGTKIISWREGAVRLTRDLHKPTGKGWDAFGDSEKELLTAVSHIATTQKVYVLAAYLVPLPPPEPSQKILNVVTLVGPSDTKDSPPNIVYSTTKHLPVPIIETYTHASRQDIILGSSDRLPIAEISVPIRFPNAPVQTFQVTSAICLDISLSSLLNYYTSLIPKNAPEDYKPPSSNPALIMNPSFTPSSSMAALQWDQARQRAVEQNAWVLRCDAPGTGISGVIDPHGKTRVLIKGEEGTFSWETQVALELAQHATIYSTIGDWWLFVIFGGLLAFEWIRPELFHLNNRYLQYFTWRPFSQGTIQNREARNLIDVDSD